MNMVMVFLFSIETECLVKIWFLNSGLKILLANLSRLISLFALRFHHDLSLINNLWPLMSFEICHACPLDVPLDVKFAQKIG